MIRFQSKQVYEYQIVNITISHFELLNWQIINQIIIIIIYYTIYKYYIIVNILFLLVDAILYVYIQQIWFCCVYKL